MNIPPGPGRSGIEQGPVAAGWRTAMNRGLLFSIVSCAACLLGMATAFASGGAAAEGHEGANWLDFLWRLINFIVLIGLLYWLLAKKVKEYLSGRRDGIRTALADAVASHQAAEKKFREYSDKLDKATGEIEQIGEMIRSQGSAEKERIIEDARREAEKIRDDAQARMEQEFAKASQQVRIDAVRLSTEMAEGLLKKQITAADHETMVNDYIEKVVKKQ
jgi:F-type H+-transporting ATPase subunit b